MNNRRFRWRGSAFGLLLMLHLAMPLLMLAQNRVHIGIGYNQSYAQLDSLNYILNRFNAENEWTDEHPMQEIHMPGGLTAHLGADFGGVLIDFQYTMRLAGSRAKGPVSPNTTEPTQQNIV